MNCNFRGCQNEVLSDSAFKMCEVCRTIFVTERLTLLVDPFSSRAEHVKSQITTQLITAQSAAEVLATRDNLQYMYLEYSKVIKLHGIEPKEKRVKLTLAEQVEEARSTQTNVRSVAASTKTKIKEKLTLLQRQMKALGCKDPSGRKRNGSKDENGKVRMVDTCINCEHEMRARAVFNDESPTDLGF